MSEVRQWMTGQKRGGRGEIHPEREKEGGRKEGGGEKECVGGGGEDGLCQWQE